ncbi:DUF1620 super, partial [Chytridiales sp. JEL 0842]
KTGLTVDVADLDTGKIESSFTAPFDVAAKGHLISASLDLLARKEGPNAFRVLTVSKAGHIGLVRENEISWDRDESLTKVAESVFVELPEPQFLSLEHDELDEPLKASEALNPVSRYIKRVSTHLQQLQSALQGMPNKLEKITSIFSKNETADSSEVILQRDRYGFRKLIVFATRTGKLVAVESLKGQVVWERYFPTLSFKEISAVRTTMVKFPPVLAAVAAEGKNFAMLNVNAMTGEDAVLQNVSTKVDLGRSATKIIKLPLKDEADQTDVFLVVDADLKARLVPDTESTRSGFNDILPKFSFHLTSHGSSSVTG